MMPGNLPSHLGSTAGAGNAAQGGPNGRWRQSPFPPSALQHHMCSSSLLLPELGLHWQNP